MCLVNMLGKYWVEDHVYNVIKVIRLSVQYHFIIVVIGVMRSISIKLAGIIFFQRVLINVS